MHKVARATSSCQLGSEASYVVLIPAVSSFFGIKLACTLDEPTDGQTVSASKYGAIYRPCRYCQRAFIPYGGPHGQFENE